MIIDESTDIRRGLLSPKELSEKLEHLEVPAIEPVYRAIPGYKVVKNYVIHFLIVVISLIILTMNLDKFGLHYYNMLSNSMENIIPQGSFILEKEVSADNLSEGDMITFINQSGISVTHEIIEVIPNYHNTGSPAFKTKGSNNKYADSDLVKPNQIVGKVIFHIPVLGNILAYPELDNE